ncbi:MAG: hypothetical protein GWP15_02255 [Nitrospirae bacterium]|nr:hypothetical protein [Nitrospirota bacterium]
MKKIAIFLTLSAIFFTGCSLADLLVDEVEVHNGLIQKMDGVLMAEENFYNEYWALADDGGIALFVEAYGEFEVSVEELDEYFTDTRFASGQQVFVDEYNDTYKGFMQEYLEKAGEFKDVIESDGYTFEAMEPYFADLDKMTEDYVEMHNKLIDTINLQADYTSEGMSY